MNLICAACGEPTAIPSPPGSGEADANPPRARPDTTTCATCGADPRLAGRYRLDAIVGRGASGVTYRATRLLDGVSVAVKEMALRHADPDQQRLVDREVQVLRQLSHPQIPKYLEHFDAGIGRHRHLYLVSEFVEGRTLLEEMGQRRYTEAEVLALVREVLGILVYLQDLRPPVIHRDLKPGNLMRRAGDGRLVLIDFGSVRDAVEDSVVGGRTIAGTFGYMAPEQYRGVAKPATDLYAVGVIALVLLTRREPDELVETWRRHVVAAPATIAFLEALVATDLADRPADARAALALLDAPPAPAPAPVRRPARSRPGCGVIGILGPLALASLFVTPLCSAGLGRLGGYNEPVFEKLRACPLAVEALGDGIGFATFGCSTGTTASGGGGCTAAWSYPVQGTRARGTYRFGAHELRNGQWSVAGVLEVGDRRIDVGGCREMPPDQ
jgi:hypothetical protein